MELYSSLTLKMALQLAAPRTWVASLTPSLFGVLFCKLQGYYLSIWQNIFLIVSCVLLQSSVNTFNDYIDFIKGNDKLGDQLEEHDAVLLYHSVNPKQVMILGVFYLLLGSCLGISAGFSGGILPLGIGLFGVLVLLFYSGGPFPISYLPIGEIVSGVVMGIFIPLGIGAVSDGNFHGDIFLYSLPFMIGIALIMMSNNTCDIEKDARVQRHTLAVLLGRQRMKKIYRFLLLLWLLFLCILPGLYLGSIVAVIFLFLIFGRKSFLFLWKSSLLPEIRIEQMKEIVKANMIGNGAYLITIFLKIILERR